MNEERLRDLLTQLGLRLTKRGSNLMAPCPFHEESNPSWGININAPHYHGCFSCGKKGVLSGVIQHILACDWKTAKRMAGERDCDDDFIFPDLKNSKLIKELTLDKSVLYPFKTRKLMYQYMERRGVTHATADILGLRYDHNTGRVLVPWFMGGKLVGVTGRSIYTDCPPEYKMLPMFGTAKRDRIYMPLEVPGDKVTIVEGEIDAMRVWQATGEFVLGLGFGSFTPWHVKLIREMGIKWVVAFYDDDKAGNRLAADTEELLGEGFYFTKVKYPEHKGKADPAMLTDDGIRSCMAKAKKLSFGL